MSQNTVEMEKPELDISLDHPQGVFYPGNEVAGTVILKLSPETSTATFIGERRSPLYTYTYAISLKPLLSFFPFCFLFFVCLRSPGVLEELKEDLLDVSISLYSDHRLIPIDPERKPRVPVTPMLHVHSIKPVHVRVIASIGVHL